MALRDIPLVLLLSISSVVAVARPANAKSAESDATGANAPAEQTKKAEAAQRFDRALQLFEAGDNASALAEFKRIYEILPEPVVLYNIGLVYAAMSRPVEAVDTLDQIVGSKSLSPAQAERAQQMLTDQRARIGRLTVVTLPESARVEVDNIEAARTPFGAPIRISEGSHVVGAVAEGYAPAHKEVLIAGNADVTVKIVLVPTQSKQMANLSVRTSTFGADVVIDGKDVGKTPLTTSVTLVPGRHVVELRRKGYVSLRREVDVGPGGTAEITSPLVIDHSVLDVVGAILVLDVSESPAELTVDGTRMGVYREPVRLPPGPHHLSVVAGGFTPQEREVTLDGAKATEVHFDLEPTPERRKDYTENAQLVRALGWGGVISGAVIAGGGATLAIIASGQKSDAQDSLSAVLTQEENSNPPCDWREGYAAEGSDGSLCKKTKADARGDMDAADTNRVIGFVGAGVGGAIAVTGLVMLIAGNDPNKYDKAATRTAAQKTRVSVMPGPGEFGTGLRISF